MTLPLLKLPFYSQHRYITRFISSWDESAAVGELQVQICRSWLGDPAVNTCLCILACSNRMVTFTHVPGTVAKFIGGGKIALQLKERRKSEKVSIPPLCVDTAGICNVSVTFRILDSY